MCVLLRICISITVVWRHHHLLLNIFWWSLRKSIAWSNRYLINNFLLLAASSWTNEFWFCGADEWYVQKLHLQRTGFVIFLLSLHELVAYMNCLTIVHLVVNIQCSAASNRCEVNTIDYIFIYTLCFINDFIIWRSRV